MTQGVKPTDKSGSITLGGTAQTVMAVNGARLGFTFQNLSGADLWIDFTGTATTDKPSLRIAAGALYEPPYGLCQVSAMSVIGATTGQKFTCWEY